MRAQLLFACLIPLALTVSTDFSLAQTTSTASKAKNKKAKPKTTKAATEELPPKETPSTEVTPEMTAPPVQSPAPETTTPQQLPQPVMETPVTPSAPAAPAEAKAAEPSNTHLFGLSAAVGLPHPLRLGLDYVHSSKLFSVEAGYGSFGLNVNDTSVSTTNMEVGLRWHPFRGSFFLGALVGNRKLAAEKTEVITAQSINAKAEIASNYFAPYLGWMWGNSKSGFFAGMDFGYLSPSSVTTTLSTNADNLVKATPQYQQLDADVRKQGKDLGEIGLPMFGLLRLGWLF